MMVRSRYDYRITWPFGGMRSKIGAAARGASQYQERQGWPEAHGSDAEPLSTSRAAPRSRAFPAAE
jgi:hypothetical protein